MDIEDAVEGRPNLDWIAFAQDSTGENLIPYSRSTAFELRPGNGIWFLSKHPWEISPQLLPSVSLSPAGTFPIPLQDGWNIISNPFDIDLDWEDITEWNGISQSLWAWDGSYLRSETFEAATKQGQAYYFFNAEQLSSLQLPYPGLANPFLSKGSVHAAVEAFTLSIENENSYSAHLTLGRSNEALPGVDRLDHLAPPGHFSTIELISSKNASSKLAQDIQPLHQDLYRYDLVLTSKDKQPVKVQVQNLGAFNTESIILVNLLDATTYDLQDRHSFWITPEKEKMSLAVFVGSSSAVQGALDSITPVLHTLKQNYPNPLQSSTTIEFSLPDPQHATLSIYDTMGRLVKVLLDKDMAAGLHRIEWHGDGQSVRQLANGIYFYRLKTDSQTFQRKMILLR